jgi:quercetin dioxygenase-like cupin family protein
MKSVIVNPLFKDSITFLKTAEETRGAYAEHLLTLMPGGGNPMHVHRAFTETFVAVKGVLGIQLKNERKLLLPGESYTVRRNEPHCFFNNSDEAIVFRIVHKPGHTGMENMLRIMYGLAADGLTNKNGIPKNIFTLAVLGDMGDSRVVGPMAVLNPFLSILARRARKKGLDRQLIDRYCQ